MYKTKVVHGFRKSEQVVHGFRKSEQNEKMYRGEPYSGHESCSQALQQPEHSVLPLISENRHVLIVTVSIWWENPRWRDSRSHIAWRSGGRGTSPPWNISSSHSSWLKVSFNQPIGVLGSRIFLIDSNSSRRTVSDGSWSRSVITWRVCSGGSIIVGWLAHHSIISGEVDQLKVLDLLSPMRSRWFQSTKLKYDSKSFLAASGRCGVWVTLSVYVCLQVSPDIMRRGTSVSERLWYRSTTLCPAVHRVSPYFLRVISPDHRRSHCSLEMSGHGGTVNLAVLSITSSRRLRRILRWLVAEA